MLDLDGRVVMVSGANRGINRTTVHAFARRGCRLSLGVRRPDTITDAGGALIRAYDAEGGGSAATWPS